MSAPSGDHRRRPGRAGGQQATDRAGVDHVVLERGGTAERWTLAALGLAAVAHPELDDPAPGLVATGAATRTGT